MISERLIGPTLMKTIFAFQNEPVSLEKFCGKFCVGLTLLTSCING